MAHQGAGRIGQAPDAGARFLALPAQLGLDIAPHGHHGPLPAARPRSGGVGSRLGNDMGCLKSISFKRTILA